MNWIELFIGALIGCIVTIAREHLVDIIQKIYIVYIDRKRSSMNHKLLINITKKYINESSFFLPKDNDNNEICLFTSRDWIKEIPLSPSTDGPIIVSDIEKNNKHASSEVSFGNARLFQGTICTVADYNNENESPWILASLDYFSYAKFRKQMMRVQRFRFFRPSRLVRQWLKNPLTAINEKKLPIAVGGTVALVQQGDLGLEMLVHRRSSEVFVEPNMLSFLPTFGMEKNTSNMNSSKFGILQHNFLRELGEELFGIPEVIQNDGYYDPDWFLKIEHISDVVKDWKNNKFQLRILGISIDPWNPSVHFSLEAFSPIKSYWSQYMKKGKASWEISRHESGNIEASFIALDCVAGKTLSTGIATETSRFLLSRLLEKHMIPKEHNTI